MDRLRWMGLMFARFVAISVALAGGWLLTINLVEHHYTGWVLTWILASGLVGALGGVVYLLSLDGPERFRTRPWRIGGWVAMLAAVLLPTSLSFFLLPLVLLLFPTLSLKFGPKQSLTSG